MVQPSNSLKFSISWSSIELKSRLKNHLKVIVNPIEVIEIS